MNQQALNDLKTAVERGKKSVAQLRRDQLTKFGTFLLSKEGLADDLTRMEYADGRIAVVRRNSQQNTFTVQRWLTAQEETAYRQQHQLPRLKARRPIIESGIGH